MHMQETSFIPHFPNSQNPDEAGAEKAFGSFFCCAREGACGTALVFICEAAVRKPSLVLFQWD